MLKITYVSKRKCMHHDRITGESWIKEQLINMGASKIFWCGRCNRSF